jgi:hypothetical protein
MTIETKMRVKKSSRVGLTKNHRIGWDIISNLLCVKHAKEGRSGRCIAGATGLTIGQVFNRCRKLGLKLKDYRDGIDEASRIVI